MKIVLFMHRSVGRDLLRYGKVRQLLNVRNVSVDDYDNNSGLLTRNDGSRSGDLITMPGNNTNPDNLADFFTAWPEVLNGYDVIMIKSCYPNNHIKDEVRLEALKDSYRRIFAAFERHKPSLLVLTTPPLRPLATNPAEAALAGKLADWLVSSAGPNVHIFDLYHYYAEPSGRHQGMLRRGYRRLFPWDTHPNRRAHQVAAPLLADLVAREYI